MSKILEFSKRFIDDKHSNTISHAVNFCSFNTLNMTNVMHNNHLPDIKNLIIYSGFPTFRYTRRLTFSNTDNPEIVEKIFNKAYYIEDVEFYNHNNFKGTDVFDMSQYRFIFDVPLKKLTINTMIDNFEYLSTLHIDELIINSLSTINPYFLIHKLHYVKRFIYSFMSVKHDKSMTYFELQSYSDQRLEKFELINMSAELFLLDISNFGKRLNYFSTVGFIIQSNTIFENVLTLGMNCSEMTKEKITNYKKWFPNALYINITSTNNKICDIVESIYNFYPDAIIQIEGIALSSCKPTIFKNRVTVLLNYCSVDFDDFVFENGLVIKIQNDKAIIPNIPNLYLDNAKIYSSTDKECYLINKDINRINHIELNGENTIHYENLIDSICLILHNTKLLNVGRIPTGSVIYLEVMSRDIFKMLIDEKTFPSIEYIVIDGIDCSLNTSIKKLVAKNSILSSTGNKHIIVEHASIIECKLVYINFITFFDFFTLYNSSFEVPYTILNVYAFHVLKIVNNIGDHVILNITENKSRKFTVKNNNVQFCGKLILSSEKQLSIKDFQNVDIYSHDKLSKVGNERKIIK